MATVVAKKLSLITEMRTGELDHKPDFFPAPHQTACHRCSGLLVDEFCNGVHRLCR